jgi:hypothetical protein
MDLKFKIEELEKALADANSAKDQLGMKFFLTPL